MSTVDIAVVLVGALAGGFVSGLAGFGTGITSLAIWLHVLPPAIASILAIACSVIAQSQTIRSILPAVRANQVLPFILPGLVGVPVGAAFLGAIEPALFKATVGALMLAFAIFTLLLRHEPQVSWGGRPADAVVGFAGGILGGLAGLSGVLPIMWAALRGWPRERKRALFQTYNLSMLALALCLHALSGRIDRNAGFAVLLALPGTVSGAWMGAWVYRRMNDRRFNIAVLLLLAVSGMGLIWGAWGKF